MVEDEGGCLSDAIRPLRRWPRTRKQDTTAIQPPRDDKSALETGRSGGPDDTLFLWALGGAGLTGQSLTISRADHPHRDPVGRKV